MNKKLFFLLSLILMIQSNAGFSRSMPSIKNLQTKSPKPHTVNVVDGDWSKSLYVSANKGINIDSTVDENIKSAIFFIRHNQIINNTNRKINIINSVEYEGVADDYEGDYEGDYEEEKCDINATNINLDVSDIKSIYVATKSPYAYQISYSKPVNIIHRISCETTFVLKLQNDLLVLEDVVITTIQGPDPHHHINSAWQKRNLE